LGGGGDIVRRERKKGLKEGEGGRASGGAEGGREGGREGGEGSESIVE